MLRIKTTRVCFFNDANHLIEQIVFGLESINSFNSHPETMQTFSNQSLILITCANKYDK